MIDLRQIPESNALLPSNIGRCKLLAPKDDDAVVEFFRHHLIVPSSQTMWIGLFQKKTVHGRWRIYYFVNDLPLDISNFYPLDTCFSPEQASNSPPGHKNLPLDKVNSPYGHKFFRVFSIPLDKISSTPHERFFSGRAQSHVSHSIPFLHTRDIL